uniref:DNA polymerase n=1 Tax=Bougainvillea spectabilis TaxID=146096 RepID=A0A7T1T1Z5_9CARY|nr:DNA-polymerase-like [Bougainvillea spectabilis]QPP04906.1 DNA-polymerase-like [Bougainvillea spectabilis]
MIIVYHNDSCTPLRIMKMAYAKAYSTVSSTTGLLLNRLYNKIERTTHQDPHQGLIIATHHFSDPYPLINDIDLLCLATMDLLIQFAYPSLSGYAKFTLTFTMIRSNEEEISFTLGSAIPLTHQDGKLIPMSDVYSHIFRYINKYSEIYDCDYVIRIMIRVYIDGNKKDRAPLSSEERDRSLSLIIDAGSREIDPIQARVIINRKRSYPTHITALKSSSTTLKPFIVSDIETVMIDNVHKPYAAGLMMVRPGEPLNNISIDTYFSEDYSIIFDDECTFSEESTLDPFDQESDSESTLDPFKEKRMKESFEKKSTKVLSDLVYRIIMIVRKEQTAFTIYFHNLSRFDGIMLLKHLILNYPNYKVKPLMRNNMIYEIAVYSGKKMLFCFRDSLTLLPGKLESLANNLCPGLGPKGEIPHEKVKPGNLARLKKALLEYMKQDILILGGVMQKAQEIYWNLYKIDIVSKITVSSLSLSIFRMRYYDATNWPIHIPNKNEDSFIRRGYYGGHTDAYKPYGENLYYYDVNSLYPFVMKEFPMPGGVPVWHGNLDGMDLDSIFGFIEAYVVCPKTINKPFLPYRDKNNTLLFPTGEFVGVYYSEELKYARDLGYTVIPISGYIFKKMESPFKEFVSTLFESRLKAKAEGNEALSYVYKILMNSLYGRFGINPISTTTEICDENRYKYLIRHSDLIMGEMLNDNNYIVSYHSNTLSGDVISGNHYWNPPKNSAIQLAAAITAAARIYMYPYISREDCYYTDTDSVVLGQPLPKEEISSSVLGKLKLEDKIKKGYFLVPKAYYYLNDQNRVVKKFKGPAKNMVTPEWFESQYADPSRTEKVLVGSNFRIDWKSLNVIKKETIVRLGIKLGNKRIPVYHGDWWVDTNPIEINDLSCLDHISRKIVNALRKKIMEQEDQKRNEPKIE